MKKPFKKLITITAVTLILLVSQHASAMTIWDVTGIFETADGLKKAIVQKLDQPGVRGAEQFNSLEKLVRHCLSKGAVRIGLPKDTPSDDKEHRVATTIVWRDCAALLDQIIIMESQVQPPTLFNNEY